MKDEKLPEGIKWTKQRKDIFEVLKGAKKPLSAHDIYQEILKDSSIDTTNFAISTVYRSLAIFEEKGLLEKSILLGSDTAVYELCEGNHKHYAVCLSCHKLVPLKHCPFEHINHDHMESEEGDFVVTGHKLELYGYCKECKMNHTENC